MKFFNSKITSVIVVALIIFGIAVHETKLDKLSSFTATLPIIAAYEGLHLTGGPAAAHLHVERVTVREVADNFVSANPFLVTRHHEDKKYRSGRPVNGHHPFDDYLLPLAS